jgi:hypothetical protein
MSWVNNIFYDYEEANPICCQIERITELNYEKHLWKSEKKNKKHLFRKKFMNS